jgi:hypothetical protein
MFIFVLFGESRLLILWCVSGRCDIAGNDGDRTCQVLGGWMIERSGDTV